MKALLRLYYLSIKARYLTGRYLSIFDDDDCYALRLY
jgi:hypothetical protein